MEEIIKLLPNRFKDAIKNELANKEDNLEEIRIRLGQPLECVYTNRFKHLPTCIANKDDCLYIVNQLSRFSLYRLERELKEGYITIAGGHRVGIAGAVNTIDGQVEKIHHICFFNIRVAKQIIGSAEKLISNLYTNEYGNTLIVGPPKSGKTTILRDLSRILSSGWVNHQAVKVGIVDERSEIAAAMNGVPQHDVGPRTDVLDGCPKTEGMMMFIRSMSPEVIVADEIGHQKDVNALIEAMNAGISVICTAHGSDLSQIRQRPSFKKYHLEEIFQFVVVLSDSPYPGFVKRVYRLNKEASRLVECGLNHEDSRNFTNYRSNDLDWLHL